MACRAHGCARALLLPPLQEKEARKAEVKRRRGEFRQLLERSK